MDVAEGEMVDTRARRAAATRETLVRVGRTLFEERGYFAIGTPELVAAAGVTRGALYHHFAGKLELFETVFRLAEKELFEQAMGLFHPSWTAHTLRLRNGVGAYLKAVAASAGRQRILLIDGPAVLGWVRWREMESASFRELLRRNIRALMEEGAMAPGDSDAVCQLLLAAFNEAALAIAHAPAQEREGVRMRVTDALMMLIEGLLRSGAQGN